MNILNVYSKEGRLEMTCYGVGAIPYHSIESLAKNGRTFRWNGEKISVKQVMELDPDNKKKAKKSVIEEPTDTKVDITKPTKSRKGRKIYCAELNKTFDTAAQAAKELNINPAQISQGISKGKPVRGYTFTVKEE